MSFLTYRITMMRPAVPFAARIGNARTFTKGGRQFALNEDLTSDSNQKKEIDEHKHDSLNKQKNDQGHWKDQLASNSEAAIKADRDETHNTADDIKNLQKEGEQLGKNKQ